MSDRPISRILKIVEEALDLPPTERDAFIERAANGDAQLLAQVRLMLAADIPDDFVQPPSTADEPSLAPSHTSQRLGDFELLEEVGRGGMGVVYRARQRGLDRLVAVKVLPSIRRNNPVSYERFRREALAASQLRHEGLIEVIASGADEEKAWYAMPFVDGHDLHVEIAAQDISDTINCLLPPYGTSEYISAVALEIARVADGLQHAHENGVVHRDVKPRNLMLDRSGRMSLTDFGLARVTGTETLTETGAMQGTPHYMSPEQAHALADPITERTDIYSICVVLFELLTRRKPYQGDDLASILSQIASGTHRRLRRLNARVPQDLATICEKGMAHRPADRYPSAEALALDLRRFLANEAISARPMSRVKLAWRWTRRRPWRVATTVAALALVTSSAVITSVQRRRAAQEALLDPIRQLAAIEAPSQTPSEAELAAAWLSLARVEAMTLESEDAEAARLARSLVSADIEVRLARLNSAFMDGLGPRRDPRYGAEAELETDPARLVEGLVLAAESAKLYPGQPEIEALSGIDRVLPRVSVRLGSVLEASTPARVVAQTIDHVTGELSAVAVLGDVPLVGRRLPPGSYRFTVILDDGRFAELERDLEFRPSVTEVVAWPRSTAEIGQRMVLVAPEGGVFPPTDERPFGCVTPRAGASLVSFWIGRTELSNATFIAYLRATGRAVPSTWSGAGFDLGLERLVGPEVPGDFDHERWTRLPALHLSYADLRGCAEWLGCRVPTHLELEYAQRGPRLALTPPGLDPRVDPRGPGESIANVDGRQLDESVDGISRLLTAAMALVPVDAPGTSVEPFGLHHPYGNASEWTSSRAIQRSGPGDGYLFAHPSWHLVLGESWNARTIGAALDSHSAEDTGPNSASSTTGLRCARSAQTPE